MNALMPLGLLIGACAAAYWLTAWIRRYAVDRALLDVPNRRSSHSRPTPRGGGIAIVGPTLAIYAAAGPIGAVPLHSAAAIVVAGVIVAAVGFLDDRNHMPRRWRLLAHLAAAGCLVWGLGGIPPIEALGTSADGGWMADVAAVLLIAWVVNLTNFMDGIDGLAAVEAISVSLGGLFAYWLSGAAHADWIGPLTLAGAAAGFLFWNWPPAQIFMGDVGSGFLGLMMASCALEAAAADPPLMWSWLILLGVFVVDASVTLARRIVRGERFYEAHRSHAYQHASAFYGAHRPVTIAVLLINGLWLLPIALLVAAERLDGLVGLVTAYTPLVAATIRMGGGLPEPRPTRSARV